MADPRNPLQNPPQPWRPGMPPPSGAPGQQQGPNLPGAAVATQNGQGSNGQQIGSAIRYNWDNPTTAMANVLMDRGYNKFAANPALNMMMRAAPGLATSYLVNGATNGGVTNQENMYQDFASYLNSAIGNGGIYGSLSRGQAQLPDALDAVRRNMANPNAAAAQSNPLLMSLQNMTNDSNGLGALDALFSMQSPMMNASTRAGTESMYNGPFGLKQQAGRRFSDISNLGPSGEAAEDLWYFLFGR